jgi:predicted DCC family thiol-disulfide oxidoreductase YuxK
MPKRDWKPELAADLPDGLVLFDGFCHVCSGGVRFLLTRDHAGLFTYVPCQSSWGHELMERFGIDRDFAETFAFVDNGRILFKSDAGIASLRRLPGWQWIAIARFVPRFVRDALYDLLARNRYKWFGKRDVCMALPPGTHGRFLTKAPTQT